jgi:hypothetical protein
MQPDNLVSGRYLPLLSVHRTPTLGAIPIPLLARTGVSIRYAATRMGFQCVRLIFIRYEKARCSG